MPEYPVIFRAALLAGLLASGSMVTADDQRPDDLLSDYNESTPGVLIGMVRDGELAETAVAGMADLRFGIPLEATTRVNIGSTAKQFTGMALALLHDRGELSLDDDVREHIPELPEFEHTVRLHHLLSHTSGYREFINARGAGRRAHRKRGLAGWRCRDRDGSAPARIAEQAR